MRKEKESIKTSRKTLSSVKKSNEATHHKNLLDVNPENSPVADDKKSNEKRTGDNSFQVNESKHKRNPKVQKKKIQTKNKSKNNKKRIKTSTRKKQTNI